MARIMGDAVILANIIGIMQGSRNEIFLVVYRPIVADCQWTIISLVSNGSPEVDDLVTALETLLGLFRWKMSLNTTSSSVGSLVYVDSVRCLASNW